MAVPVIDALSLVALLAQATPVPPPVEQATADCDRPVYATDRLVCGDPVLRPLDSRLKTALAATTPPRAPLIEQQEDWFRRSRRCAFQNEHRTCTIAAYNERLRVITLAARPPGISGSCRMNDGTDPVIGASGRGAVLMRDGRVIAVALPATPAWQPFVRLNRNESKATLRGLDSRLLATCRFGGRAWK